MSTAQWHFRSRGRIRLARSTTYGAKEVLHTHQLGVFTRHSFISGRPHNAQARFHWKATFILLRWRRLEYRRLTRFKKCAGLPLVRAFCHSFDRRSVLTRGHHHTRYLRWLETFVHGVLVLCLFWSHSNPALIMPKKILHILLNWKCAVSLAEQTPQCLPFEIIETFLATWSKRGDFRFKHGWWRRTVRRKFSILKYK